MQCAILSYFALALFNENSSTVQQVDERSSVVFTFEYSANEKPIQLSEKQPVRIAILSQGTMEASPGR